MALTVYMDTPEQCADFWLERARYHHDEAQEMRKRGRESYGLTAREFGQRITAHLAQAETYRSCAKLLSETLARQTSQSLSDDEAFFYAHAGYSYNPKIETGEQGRIRGARELAAAEAHGKAQGWWTELRRDSDVMEDDVDTVGRVARGEIINLCVILHNSDNEIIGVLGGVTVKDESDPYLRVVAADLMCEYTMKGSQQEAPIGRRDGERNKSE